MRIRAFVLLAALVSLPSIAGADAFTPPPLPPCGNVPPPDSLMGSAGSTAPCVRPSDARSPTTIQAAVTTTTATGTWSVTWAKPFASAMPYVNVQPDNVAGQQPYICNIVTSTTTMATGKCWQTNTSTLPLLAPNLLGMILNPTAIAPNIQVRVVGRDTTQ